MSGFDNTSSNLTPLVVPDRTSRASTPSRTFGTLGVLMNVNELQALRETNPQLANSISLYQEQAQHTLLGTARRSSFSQPTPVHETEDMDLEFGERRQDTSSAPAPPQDKNGLKILACTRAMKQRTKNLLDKVH